MAEAELWLEETLKLDPMDAGAMNELVAVYEEQELEDKSKRAEESLVQLLRDDPHNYIALAQDYADAGQYGDALNVLRASNAVRHLPSIRWFITTRAVL